MKPLPAVKLIYRLSVIHLCASLYTWYVTIDTAKYFWQNDVWSFMKLGQFVKVRVYYKSHDNFSKISVQN